MIFDEMEPRIDSGTNGKTTLSLKRRRFKLALRQAADNMHMLKIGTLFSAGALAPDQSYCVNKSMVGAAGGAQLNIFRAFSSSCSGLPQSAWS